MGRARLTLLGTVAVAMMSFAAPAAPAAAAEYLKGGGFEGGTRVILKEAGKPDSEGIDHPDWQESDSVYATPICSVTFCPEGAPPLVGPRGGQNWVLFGGYEGPDVHTQSVSQTVTLPAAVEGGVISFYIWVGQFDREAALNVKFDQAQSAHLEDDDLESVGPGYQPLTFEAPIAGGGRIEPGQHVVSLQFISDSSASPSVTMLSVDDVSFTATPIPTPIPVIGPPAPGGSTSKPAPDTTITKVQLYKAKQGKKGSPKLKKRKTGKPAKARFTFTGSGGEGELSFECKLDGGQFKPCTSPTVYKKLKLGGHKFEVRAVDRAGNVDATPAVQEFKAKQGSSGKTK